MDCICLKRKHKKRGEQKKFRPLSPHASPAHSQPSTLGHIPDGRLPKVNSTGLWMGAPSLYAAGPAPAYYYGRPHAAKPRAEPLRHIQRASSEIRLPQKRKTYIAPKPVYGSHNNVYLRYDHNEQPPRRAMSLQRVPVHSAQRIFHSQQLAPVYEAPPIRTMDIYDVYQFAGGSQSKLLETKHSQFYQNGEFRPNSRLERSKSDAQEKRERKPNHYHDGRREKPQAPAYIHKRATSNERRENSLMSNTIREENPSTMPESNRDSGISHNVSRQHSNSAHTNRGFSSDSAQTKDKIVTKPHSVNSEPSSYSTSSSLPKNLTDVTPADEVMIPSATDSMKLQAKNKTDDQKTAVPGVVSVMVEKENVKLFDKDEDINPDLYIYSVPNKGKYLKGEDNNDNPIISRMKEMVIEKSRYNNSSPRQSQSSNPYELYKSESSQKLSEDSSVYQEIHSVTKIQRTEVIESVETAGKNDENKKSDDIDGLILPDISELEKTWTNDLPNDATPPEIPPPIKSNDLKASTNEETNLSSPNILREDGAVSPRGSVDADGANDELSKAGKRITASAFEFLDTYLSDDEAGESHIESPQLSPNGMRAQTVGD